MADEPEVECKTITQYILYKMDRNLAIIGIIGIALFALYVVKSPENIVSAAIGGLVGYVGGRSK